MKKSLRNSLRKFSYSGPEIPGLVFGGKVPQKYSKDWLQAVKLSPFCLMASASGCYKLGENSGANMTQMGGPNWVSSGLNLWAGISITGSISKVGSGTCPDGCGNKLSCSVTLGAVCWPSSPGTAKPGGGKFPWPEPHYTNGKLDNGGVNAAQSVSYSFDVTWNGSAWIYGNYQNVHLYCVHGDQDGDIELMPTLPPAGHDVTGTKIDSTATVYFPRKTCVQIGSTLVTDSNSISLDCCLNLASC